VITRRAFLAVISTGACVSALAQQSAKVWRVGFLGPGLSKAPSSSARIDALRIGLREHGYVEGRNMVLEIRWAEGNYERLAGLADELLRLKIDVLVTYGTPGGMAAKKATRTVPVVLASASDPVVTGIVASLARPGGNITGTSVFSPTETAKRLELLKDAFPQIRRVALLTNSDNLAWKPAMATIEKVASGLQLSLQLVEVRTVDDFPRAFAAMVEHGAEAVVLFEDPFFTGEAGKIAALAIRHRLPSIGQVTYAEAGGLIGNGANQLELFRRAGGYVDRILKGAKPADLPIEQAARFELIVNMNTATALGVSISKALRFRADRIIE
jgi:putative ABC transport system substrate-binding protein